MPYFITGRHRLLEMSILQMGTFHHTCQGLQWSLQLRSHRITSTERSTPVVSLYWLSSRDSQFMNSENPQHTG